MASRTERLPGQRAHPPGKKPAPAGGSRGTPGRRPAPARGGSPGSGAARYLSIVLALIGALVAHALWPIPLWVPALYLVASIVCFIVYAVDKSAARAGRRRVPEKTLLLLGVIGGWPGAVVAQQTLRHKTQKVSFRRAFWATVLVNLIVFAVFATPAFTLLAETIRPTPS